MHIGLPKKRSNHVRERLGLDAAPVRIVRYACSESANRGTRDGIGGLREFVALISRLLTICSSRVGSP